MVLGIYICTHYCEYVGGRSGDGEGMCGCGGWRGEESGWMLGWRWNSEAWLGCLLGVVIGGCWWASCAYGRDFRVAGIRTVCAIILDSASQSYNVHMYYMQDM